MVARLSVTCLALALLATPSAYGQQDEYKDPREIQAQKDCLTGKVESGVALLADLYANTGNANFIYNQARCYEQSARADEAINRFREYVRVAKELSPADQADVDRHIAECRAMQAEQEKKERAALAPTSAATPTPATPPGLDLSSQSSSQSTSEPPPFYKKWWFWTGAAAVVVAGTVTGIVLATRSSGACDGANLACMGVK